MNNSNPNRKLRIQLTVNKDVKRAIEDKQNFNASEFFETKFREEFMEKSFIKQKIQTHEEIVLALKNRLKDMEEGKIKKPEHSDDRCCLCSMLYNEKISIRRKKVVYKNFHVCGECYQCRTNEIGQQLREIKTKESELNAGKDLSTEK